MKLPNGTQALVTHIGTVNISNSLVLDGVLCAPSFIFSLLSVNKLDSSLCVIFLEKFCYMQVLSSWMRIRITKIQDGLYFLCPSFSSCETTNDSPLPRFHTNHRIHNAKAQQDPNLWHFRLGHPLAPRLSLINSSIPNVKCYYDFECIVCHLAKHKRKPFHFSSISSTCPFDLIHCNIWGHYSQAIIQGHHFFITIMDDFSHVTWLFLMKFKSEVRSLIQSFICMVQTQFNVNVKQIRTDNRDEFVMHDFYKSSKILHPTTCACTP